MSHVDHFTHGPTTPAIGYVFMVIAAVVGLMCTVRATTETGSSRRNWLIIGAASLAAGIWTLHFIAMLGFRVSGSPVRYNVPLTLISLVVAIIVVGGGVLMVGYGRNRNRALLLGGLGTGIGVAAMHYTGMASVQLNGTIHYRIELVAASLVIAVAAATAALWLVFNIRTFWGAVVAALVMGVAVSSMHYTGMVAVSVELAPTTAPVAGATSMEFLVPLTIGLGSLLLIAMMVVAVSPVEFAPRDDWDDEPAEEERENLFAPPPRRAEQRPAPSQPAQQRPAPSQPAQQQPAPSQPAQQQHAQQPTPPRHARPLPARPLPVRPLPDEGPARTDPARTDPARTAPAGTVPVEPVAVPEPPPERRRRHG